MAAISSALVLCMLVVVPVSLLAATGGLRAIRRLGASLRMRIRAALSPIAVRDIVSPYRRRSKVCQMLKSQSISRAFSVSLLVSLSVGFSLAPLSAVADSVSIPPASSPTNIITFVESILEAVEVDAWVIQDYETYLSSYQDLMDSLQSINNLVLSTLDSLEVWRDNLESLVEESFNQEETEYILELQSLLYDTVVDIDWTFHSFEHATNSVNQAIEAVQSANEEVQQQRVIQSATMTVTPASGSGGMCNCPDYSSILTNIKEILVGIRVDQNASLNRIRDAVELGSWGIVNFLYEFDLSLGHEPNNDDEIGLYAGNIVGNVVSNSYDFLYNLNYALRLNSGSFLNSDIVVGSNYPLIMRALWNDILLPYAEVFNPNIDSPNTDNRMINAFRDYYINYTNSLTTVIVTNTAYNPLWVSLTGSVDLSSVTISNLQHTYVTIDAYSTNAVHTFVDIFLDSFTNHPLQVVVTNTLAGLRNDVNVSIDLAEEEAGEAEDPEEDDTELGSFDMSAMSRIRSIFIDTVTEYTRLFDSFPDEEPGEMMIWQGMQIGGDDSSDNPSEPTRFRDGSPAPSIGLSIPSLYYNPSNDNLFVNAIHGICGAAWTLGFVWVFFGLAAFNLIVARGLIACTFRVLLGDSRGAAHALERMVDGIGDLIGGSGRRRR